MLPVHPSPLAHPAADVWTLLADIAELTPDAPAFLHGERALSFAGLLDGAERAAQGLADLGVGPGDRVALWLPNIPAYPILYFACARLGAIAVAVNTRYRAVEVADIVGRSGAKVLACAPGFRRIDFLSILADIDPQALGKLSAIVTVGETPDKVPPAIEHRRRVPFGRLLSRPPYAHNHASARMPCNIFTTSGTTARVRSPAMPSKSHGPSASTRPRHCRWPSCRCAACSASTRRWRPWRPAGRACWSSPTRSRRSRG